MWSRRRGMLYITGALILAAPCTAWVLSSYPKVAEAVAVDVSRNHTADTTTPAGLAQLAQRDPMALVELGRDRYQKDIREYRCVLVKQERLDGDLSPVQEVEVRYREAPRAIYMLWRKNADQAARALYMDTPEFINEAGERLARVEPAGTIARLLVSDLLVPIHGAQARRSSRRAIDECGFGATFDLLFQFNAIAAERGVLDLKYGGTGEVDGRPTFVLVRDLPYDNPEGPYPDARMLLHLDQEWLLPVAVFSYADHNEQTLLGSYVFTQVDLQPSFDATAFEF